MSAASPSPALTATAGRWRWRLAGLALVAAYLAQDFLGLHWRWLAAMQTEDWFKYVTGAGLVLYLGWLWSLFARRVSGLRGRDLNRTMRRHEQSAALAPALLYLHTVQLGYGYLLVLSAVFLTAVAVGTASPVALGIRSRVYLAGWLIAHVMLAALVTLLALYHGYIALYYK